MSGSTIVEYILAERARGVHDEDIRVALLTNKWREEDINSAFASFAAPVNEDSRVAPGFSVAYLKYLFHGRVGRFYYFEGSIILLLLLMVVLSPLVFFLSKETPVKEFISSHPVIYLLGVPYWLFQLSLITRRLHDLNRSGWWALLVLVPIVSSLFGLYTTFFKGSEGVNRYGAPEPYLKTTSAAWRVIFRI